MTCVLKEIFLDGKSKLINENTAHLFNCKSSVKYNQWQKDLVEDFRKDG
jgi:hypothetical protein